MTTLQMVLAIVLIILALAIIVVVLMQKSREADASAVTGGSSDFFDKTAGHQKDDTLANITKVLGFIFFAVALATTLVILFV